MGQDTIVMKVCLDSFKYSHNGLFSSVCESVIRVYTGYMFTVDDIKNLREGKEVQSLDDFFKYRKFVKHEKNWRDIKYH